MGTKFFVRFFSTIADILTQSISIVKDVISDPRANPTQTMLVVGILMTLVLVLVLLSLMAYFIASDRLGRQRRIVFPTKELTRHGVLIGWAVFLLLMVGLFWSVETYSAKPSTCAVCHTSQKQAKSLSRSSHKDISCMACHQSPGVVGLFVSKVDYLRWIVRFPEGNKGKHQADIVDQSCLRCHGDVERRTVSYRAIRVQHIDIAKAGYKCIDCHNTVAHGDEIASPKRPSMEKCVLCHNQKVASANCEVCHVTSGKQADVAGGQRLFTREYIRPTLGPPENCRGCHNVEVQCTTCHGLEMPHPEDFRKKGKHARDGFLNKDLCWRCHQTEYKFCNTCHKFPSPHGLPDSWKELHGKAAQNPETTIYWPEVDEVMKGCGGCHSTLMCRSCHDDGRRAIK